MMKKRILSMILCLALCVSMVPAAFAANEIGNFQKSRTYSGQFADVPASSWYYDSVKTGYELGLVNGSSGTAYSPNGNVTIAETITFACRIHNIYYGGNGQFTQGSPWYQVYVDYAVQNGIIPAGRYSNYNASATRAQCAVILEKSLSRDALTVINNVSDLPDVDISTETGLSILRLYQAGILTGNDGYGTFAPNTNIKRSEIAAIVTRLADPSLRKKFTLIAWKPDYSLYTEKINEYKTAMSLTGTAFFEKYYDDSSINAYLVGLLRASNGVVAYTLYDIDNNGINELIFSDTNNIIDMYTLNKKGLVKLFENCYAGVRWRLHILSDGNILSEGSGGASTSSCQLYCIDRTSGLLSAPIEAYYYNTNGPDSYMTGYTYVSVDKYCEKVNGWMENEVFDTLPWTVIISRR